MQNETELDQFLHNLKAPMGQAKQYKEEHSKALNYTKDFNRKPCNKQPAEQHAVISKYPCAD